MQARIDGGGWTNISGSLNLEDGIHTIQLRAMDKAGNLTETPPLEFPIDATRPEVELAARINLGDALNYNLEDEGSGLSSMRVVIEDDEERYSKVTWDDGFSGQARHSGDFTWDGKFADGTKAAPGEYLITLKVKDKAGNETQQTALVEVTLLNAMLPIADFTPPPAESTPPAQPQSMKTFPTVFGGQAVTTQAGKATSMTTSSGGVSQSVQPAQSSAGVLWGAAALAATTTAVAAWATKRKEKESHDKEKSGMTEVQRRHQTKVEKRWRGKNKMRPCGRVTKPTQFLLNFFLPFTKAVIQCGV